MKSISKLKNFLELEIVFNKEATEIERQIVLNEEHFNRGDISDYLIRSTQSRIKYKDNNFEPSFTPELIKKGYITIGNNNFGQYKGELHLSKKDHLNDRKRKNVVAKISDEEIFLLDLIPP
ncbi:MAG: phospho-sugar glycosidase domain-containing protein [Cetobacterium sp.]